MIVPSLFSLVFFFSSSSGTNLQHCIDGKTKKKTAMVRRQTWISENIWHYKIVCIDFGICFHIADNIEQHSDNTFWICILRFAFCVSPNVAFSITFHLQRKPSRHHWNEPIDKKKKKTFDFSITPKQTNNPIVSKSNQIIWKIERMENHSNCTIEVLNANKTQQFRSKVAFPYMPVNLCRQQMASTTVCIEYSLNDLNVSLYYTCIACAYIPLSVAIRIQFASILNNNCPNRWTRKKLI